jgi:hypothetical protein
MEWIVTFLDLLDPQVQRIQFLFDEVLEAIGSVESAIDLSQKR